jgi:preprotein translocase subunit SecY
MISAFKNTWKVPELRARIQFTILLILLVRLGVHITLPGVDAGVIAAWMEHQSKDVGNPFAATLTIFAGGGLQQAGIFALGIMPYISASIMVQLLTAVVPKLARLSREDNGRQKISQYTRYITIVIALVQGYFIVRSLAHPGSGGAHIFLSGIEHYGTLVPDPSILWHVLTVTILVSGTLLLSWFGDQITDRGIGNGTSIIICVNIISSLPGALVQAWNHFVVGKGVSPFNSMMMVVMLVLILIVIAGTIALTQAQRRIAIQYAKRVVGRKQFGGQTQYLPLKVNYAGVMPIIFASAIISLPAQMLVMITSAPWARKISDLLTMNSAAHYLFGTLCIFFFSYFWVATMFQPSQISEDLKRNGGYIPGIRPGKPTSDFLDFTMSRLTFAGAIFLTLIFVLPPSIGRLMNLPSQSMLLQFCGGTSLLILVGVILDVMRQVETQLLQRHYDGFLRKGRIKGRYDRLAQAGEAATGSSLVYLWLVIAVLIVLGVALSLAK